LSCLVAVSSKECYIWPVDENNLDLPATKQPIVLSCSQKQVSSNREKKHVAENKSSTFSLVDVSPNSPFIALTCSDTCQVNCWNLDTLLTSPQNLEKQQPITLAVYDNLVHCLTFDTSGRYLATSDGPDCTIWDMSKVKNNALDDTDSIMCCGHEPTTKITSLAFGELDGGSGGPLLATVSNTGRVAVFNSGEFRPGGVCGPYATAQINVSQGNGGEEGRSAESSNEDDLGEVKLLWISQNRLLIAIPGEDLHFYSVSGIDTLTNKRKEDISTSTAATAAETSDKNLTTAASTRIINSDSDSSKAIMQPGMLRALSIGRNLTTSSTSTTTRLDQTAKEVVEYVSSPLTPPRGSDDLDSVEDLKEDLKEEKMVLPAPIRTTTQKKESQPQSPPQPRRMSASSTAPTHQQYYHHHHPYHHSGAFDGQLEQRIQQLRDTPPRGDREKIELTGWGRGVPGGGGGGVPSAVLPMPMPWGVMNQPMVAGVHPPHYPQQYQQPYQQHQPVFMYPTSSNTSSGGVGVPMVLTPGGYGHHAMHAGVMTASSAMPMIQYPQYAQYYPTQQQGYPMQSPVMMMVPVPQGTGGVSGIRAVPPLMMTTGMPQQHSSGRGRMQPPPPSAPYPGSPISGGAGVVYPSQLSVSSPRSPHGLGAQQQRHRGSSSGGGGGSSGSVQQQQQQLWAGVAPGYMSYQHGVVSPRTTAASISTGRQQQQPVSPSSSGSGGGGDSGKGKKAISEEYADEMNNIDRNFSDETESSLETHQHNNKNGAAAARGSGEFSNSSSLTPSPRQSNNRHKRAINTNHDVATPPLTPMAAAVPLALSSSGIDTKKTAQPHPDSPAAKATPTTEQQGGSSIIYLGNLPQSVDDHTLYWTCSQFGQVVHVQIILDKATQTSRGYGFVTFAHPMYAEVAMKNLNGLIFGGHKIKAAPTYKKSISSTEEGGSGSGEN
jgi:WD40 repeat protein